MNIIIVGCFNDSGSSMLLIRRLLSAGYHIGAWASPSPRSRQPTFLSASLHSRNEPQVTQTTTQLKTHTITWLTNDDTSTDINTTSSQIVFDAYDGEILRTAALRRKVASPHNGRANLINCRGLGTCGTCAVEIVTGRVEPPQRNPYEQLRFQFPPHNFHNHTKLRLACQIQVKSDVHVLKRTGFWGHKDGVASLSTPELYFGHLEYVLDNKSPDEPFEKDTVKLE